MIVRKGKVEDIPYIEQIYVHAKEQMVKNNNPHQWDKGYPNIEVVSADIENGNCYILEEKGRVCGVFALFFTEDPTYSYIEGKWINNYPYATIHRIASNNTTKGVLKAATEYALQFVDNVKIDTHKDNIVMQNALNKLGFIYCGIIYLSNGDPRLAFQKVK